MTIPYPIISDGIELIKHAEGLRLKAYRDSGDLWTIGFGHTKDVFPNSVITPLQAEMYLVEDLVDSLTDISKYVKVELNAYQKAAVSSFIFNVGGTKFRKSTLCKLLNEGKFADASLQFERWKYAKNKSGYIVVHSWQEKRRRAEKKLFLGQDWQTIKEQWDKNI